MMTKLVLGHQDLERYLPTQDGFHSIICVISDIINKRQQSFENLIWFCYTFSYVFI